MVLVALVMAMPLSAICAFCAALVCDQFLRAVTGRVITQQILQSGDRRQGRSTDFHTGRGTGLVRSQDQPIRFHAAIGDDGRSHAQAGLVDRVTDALQRIVATVDGNAAGRLIRVFREAAPVYLPLASVPPLMVPNWKVMVVASPLPIEAVIEARPLLASDCAAPTGSGRCCICRLPHLLVDAGGGHRGVAAGAVSCWNLDRSLKPASVL